MTNEIMALAKEFQAASKQTARALFDSFKESGEEYAKEWAAAAKITAGRHGKHYHKSITSEPKISRSITVDVGPQTNRLQGSMGKGFEFGDSKSPAHLDGANLLVAATERTERRADSVIGHLLP